MDDLPARLHAWWARLRPRERRQASALALIAFGYVVHYAVFCIVQGALRFQSSLHWYCANRQQRQMLLVRVIRIEWDPAIWLYATLQRFHRRRHHIDRVLRRLALGLQCVPFRCDFAMIAT